MRSNPLFSFVGIGPESRRVSVLVSEIPRFIPDLTDPAGDKLPLDLPFSSIGGSGLRKFWCVKEVEDVLVGCCGASKSRGGSCIGNDVAFGGELTGGGAGGD